MKIDNLQIPKTYSKTKTSNTLEAKEDFSKILSGAVNNTKENNVKQERTVDKVVDSAMEDNEVDKETMESMDTLLMFLNTPLIEENLVDIAELDGEQLVAINNDSSVFLNLLDDDIRNITLDLRGEIIGEVTENENMVFTENLLGTEVLGGNINSKNDETISLDDKILQKPIDLDMNSGNRLGDIVKHESGNKNLLMDNEFTPANEIEGINLEEMIKTEDLDLTKPMDEKVLEIKKEESIGDNKLLNHNLEMSQKVNMANEIEQQAKALSNENIQNINDSIIQLMETTTEGNTNVMKVQLYPEELGAVNITLKMEDGKLIAKILVDDDYVKQLFVGKIEQLNNSLIKQNVNMKDIFVELNSNSNPNGESGQNNSSFANQNKGFKFAKEPMGGISSEQIELDLGELSILA